MILPGCVVMAVPTPRGFNSACNSVEGTAATCPGTRGLFSVSTCPCGVITTLAAVSLREAEESSARQKVCKTLIYSGTASLMANSTLDPALGTALEGVILLFLSPVCDVKVTTNVEHFSPSSQLQKNSPVSDNSAI